MSRTLNLMDVLLTTSRHLLLMGRLTEALEPLMKLWNFRKLPRQVNEELQFLLSDIYLQQKKYKDARRHLTAAIALRPLKAEYCYMMAVAIEEDETADRNRAEMYYERALKLEPTDTTYLVDYASYLFTVGKAKPAMAALRKAYTHGSTDAEIVGQVANILRREGHMDEAGAKVRAALFHNHGAADFRRLWQQHQFAMIHASQQPTRPERSAPPVILKFTPAPTQRKYLNLGGKTLRIDQAQPLDEPTRKLPITEGYRRPPKKG